MGSTNFRLFAEAFVKMIKQNERLEIDKLADLIRVTPEVSRHALNYARRVQQHEGVESLAAVQEAEVEEEDYDTGDEWEGQSCPGSEIDDSDWDADSDSSSAAGSDPDSDSDDVAGSDPDSDDDDGYGRESTDSDET